MDVALDESVSHATSMVTDEESEQATDGDGMPADASQTNAKKRRNIDIDASLILTSQKATKRSRVPEEKAEAENDSTLDIKSASYVNPSLNIPRESTRQLLTKVSDLIDVCKV